MNSERDLHELKQLRSNSKSNLTRKVNQLRELLTADGSSERVRDVMREIRERFKDFQNAHEICHEQFSSETDKEASSKYYMDVVDQIATLEGEVATLLARVEQEISHSQVQRVTSAVRPEDSVSHAGSRRSFNSRRSTRSRASSRAEAAAKQAGLEAKAATLKKLHELEAQELQIRQKRMELERDHGIRGRKEGLRINRIRESAGT